MGKNVSSENRLMILAGGLRRLGNRANMRDRLQFSFRTPTSAKNDVCLLLGVEFPTSTSFWRSAKNFRTLFENVTVSTDIRT